MNYDMAVERRGKEIIIPRIALRGVLQIAKTGLIFLKARKVNVNEANWSCFSVTKKKKPGNLVKVHG